MEDEGRDDPCQDGGVDGGKTSPFPTARLALDSRDGGYAGEVDQYEEEEAIGGEARFMGSLGIAIAVGLLQVGSHLLLQYLVFAVLVVVVAVVAKAVVVAVEYAHGGCHDLLGSHARDESYVEFPVEALRCEDRLNGLAYSSDVALFLLLFAASKISFASLSSMVFSPLLRENITNQRRPRA